MTNNVWFITGAGRGMGLDITKAALAAARRRSQGSARSFGPWCAGQSTRERRSRREIFS